MKTEVQICQKHKVTISDGHFQKINIGGKRGIFFTLKISTYHRPDKPRCEYTQTILFVIMQAIVSPIDTSQV